MVPKHNLFSEELLTCVQDKPGTPNYYPQTKSLKMINYKHLFAKHKHPRLGNTALEAAFNVQKDSFPNHTANTKKEWITLK